jgi:hypothetical protein
MKRIKWIVTLVVLLALLPAGLASASPPLNATGTIVLTGVTSFGAYPRGQQCVIELGGIHEYTGTIEATCETEMRIIEHAPCSASGPGKHRENWLGHSVCAGTVDGREGAFEIHWTAQVDPDADPNTKGTEILSGSGDMADLHGTLKLSGYAGTAGIYEGFVHFDPAP